MGEIALRIHCEGLGPQDVMVSPDTTVEELLAELIQGCRLPATDAGGPIRYRLESKESGRALAPSHSVAAENLRSGENLFLRREAVPQGPAEIRRARHSIPWLLPAIVAAAALASGYGVGRLTNSAAAELAAARGQLSRTQEQLSQARSQIADLEQKPKSSQDAAAQLNTLKDQLAKVQIQLHLNQTDNQNLSAQLAAKTEQLTQARQQASQAASELQSLREQLQEAQNALRNKRGESSALLPPAKNTPTTQRAGYLNWSGTAKMRMFVQVNGNRANTGLVTGSPLPGVPCIVVPMDPLHVAIQEPPGPANNWRAVSFEVTGNGPTKVTLKWIAQ
jgi:uncharacterized membrane-anchored protein YhcB (DUF1043 family)